MMMQAFRIRTWFARFSIGGAGVRHYLTALLKFDTLAGGQFALYLIFAQLEP